MLNTQIIDRYFGNFSTVFSFNGEYVSIVMNKTAEDFLQTYHGGTYGIIQ